MGKVAQAEHPRILQLWRQGMHQRDIATQYDVSTITIYRIIRASNGGTTRRKDVTMPDRETLWCLYITDSRQQQDIACQYDVSISTVKRWLHEAGITKSREQRGRQRRKVQPPDENTLYTLYIVENRTKKDIARHYGMSESTVYGWLSEAELTKHGRETG